MATIFLRLEGCSRQLEMAVVRSLYKFVTHNKLLTSFYLCYSVYYLCVMMCVCGILIKITYLLTYLLVERSSAIR